jgi:carbon storage regulator CsrA
MLVLTRKKAQMIQIGDNIVIKVIQTGRSTVKIGVDAPANVRVLRGELSDELTALGPDECLNKPNSFRGGLARFMSRATEPVCYEAV